MPRELEHDPDARLDYTFNWGDSKDPWLGPTEVINDFDISLHPLQGPEGIQVDTADIYIGGKMVVAWLIGGVPNTTVGVTCHIVTSEGREDDRTMDLFVKER